MKLKPFKILQYIGGGLMAIGIILALSFYDEKIIGLGVTLFACGIVTLICGLALTTSNTTDGAKEK